MKRWNDKPYHSLDYMLRERYGEKVYRVALNGGMSCPNRDGTLGKKGCIFCSQGGSGDFAANAALSITEQINTQIKSLSSKRPIWPTRWIRSRRCFRMRPVTWILSRVKIM